MSIFLTQIYIGCILKGGHVSTWFIKVIEMHQRFMQQGCSLLYT